MNFPNFEINNRSIFWAGAITMYMFPLLGWSLLTLFAPEINYVDLILRHAPLGVQLFLGFIYGLGAYLIIHSMLFSGFVSNLTKPVQVMAKKLNWIQVVFLSLAAGVGEELLFRVSLQHFFGVWPTAVFFVAIHGYLNLLDRKIFMYGLFMVIVSGGFGLLYIKYGIGAAIMAHFVIDLFIFIVLKITPMEKLEVQPIEKE